MFITEVALLVAGLVALVIGYRKHNRNVLLCAALLLLASGSLSQIVTGFNDSQARHQISNVAPISAS